MVNILSQNGNTQYGISDFVVEVKPFKIYKGGKNL